MRTPACVLLLALSTAVLADDKPAKWEYAELSYHTLPGRPAGKDKEGNETPATPPSVTIRWTTGAEEVTVKGWDELAERLKVALRKESSSVSQKIQVLNTLGASGWELVDQQTTTPVGPTGGPGFGQPGGRTPGNRAATEMLFKRRVP